ncbi:MAG: type II toxin-antitoxin system VapC family toxin [Candidatus Thermoplasmatota archaeon]
MTTTEAYVLDASAAAKRVAGVEEPSVEALNAWWNDRLEHGADFLAPHLLRYELGHLLARKAREDARLTPALREEMLRQVLLGVRFADGSGTENHAPPLTYYDASYLALARATKATLVTYDDVLTKEAKNARLKVFAPS